MLKAGIRNSSARKALDLAGHRVAFEVEDCRREGEIEERLLPIAQSVKPAFDGGRALLKQDLDTGDDLLEALARQRQRRIGVSLLVGQFLPAIGESGADRIDRGFGAEGL